MNGEKYLPGHGFRDVFRDLKAKQNESNEDLILKIKFGEFDMSDKKVFCPAS